MMRFSQRLHDVLTQENWTRTKLAELCGVDLSNVSRWCRGSALPKSDALEKLIGVVSVTDAADLLVAWVADSLPPGADTIVAVKPKKPVARAAETALADEWPPGMNAATRRKFVDFSKLAMLNKDVMEIVDVLHAAAMRMSAPK